MKLIIDIPEEHYRTLQEAIKNHMESLIGKIVLNGTVLPKGHENCQPSRKGHWIDVNERLPEDGEVVIFSTKTDRVYEGRFYNDNSNQQWYVFRDENFAWNNVVTAWMPLPEPYKDMRGDTE